ncbi:PAS domain-containing protein [Mesoterricola silvestris]|uniref:PAS domain-containing protein n=1 Tax=Mesoterricola silvestris TaxID=2927979 RepID=A0AA48GRD3_9BACT|nr:PAS domain-containing protein [Mesoterricola silvestris]BDU72825.1 hypothetical protein METEAL_19990 [Mesoterricola silvestris]
MRSQDLLLALLLAVPPWVGFLTYRWKGRVGISYGYFLGGILAILAIPWPALGTRGLPSAHLGGALLGFTLFLQANRDGRNGVRRLAVGVGGSTLFAWVLGNLLGMDMRSVLAFWGTAILEGSLWLLLSDLGYRLTKGRWLSIRMPAAGGAAFLTATAIYHLFTLGVPPLSWAASLLAGILLGLVALHQLVWLRDQGIWVEGRGDGFRTALSALEGDRPPEGPTLAYAIEARQPMFLVNEKGMLLETNTAFSRLVGLPRHQMKGFLVQDLFQGTEIPTWDSLRADLLQDSRAQATATLVRRNSSFQTVRLEAVAFDRNIALVWIADTGPGSLALRGEGVVPRYSPALPARNGAPHRLPAVPALEAMLPRIQRMLPEGITAALRLEPVTLLLEEEPLRRAATQMLLHGRQGLREGTLTLTLSATALAGRPWAQLGLERSGPAAGGEGDFLGLGWLHKTVQECSGILELDQDDRGFLTPRALLPCLPAEAEAAPGLLSGRNLWILHRDPAIRADLAAAVSEAGGAPVALGQLRDLLKASRRGTLPDVLVLERTPALERWQGRLCALAGRNIPALLLDDGRPLPQGERAPRRLVLLERPFPGPDFIACILALLQ